MSANFQLTGQVCSVGGAFKQFQSHGAIKVNLDLEATYFKTALDKNSQEQDEFQNIAFKTPNYSVFSSIDIPDLVKTACETMLGEESKFEGKSSGWSLLIIDGLLIRISKHVPLQGSLYINFPPKIASKLAIINPKNNDQGPGL